MRKHTLRTSLLALGAGLACFGLTGCGDDEVIYVEDGPPAVPTGVTTITGDGEVWVLWYPVRQDDVAGYGIYRSRTLNGAYGKIAEVTGRESDSYVDRNVVNGETYFYAVDAFDNRGHESELSYEAAFDTPRPEGTGRVLNAREVSTSASGLDFSDFANSGFITAWNAADADFYVQRLDGVLYLKGTAIGGFWNDIQDLGYTDSMDEVSWAPADGWSVSPNGVELIVGHTYVIWTHDSYFAKLRVTAISGGGTPSAITFDWAYQIDQSNPELVPPPRVASGGNGTDTEEDA